MALLENINYNPSEDKMQEVFDKVNNAIDTINAVLGGGTAGQGIKKLSSTDFDYTKFDIPLFDDSFTSITLTTGAFNGNGLGYRKNALGQIELKGTFLVPYNNVGAMFTLPVGFRPARRMFFICIVSSAGSGNKIMYLDIDTDGIALLNGASPGSGNVTVTLDGLIFHA